MVLVEVGAKGALEEDEELLALARGKRELGVDFRGKGAECTLGRGGLHIMYAASSTYAVYNVRYVVCSVCVYVRLWAVGCVV